MITLVVWALTLAPFLVAVLRPKAGALVIWPVLMCYPRGYWREHGPLPAGVTFDDLTVLVAAASLFVWRGKLRLGWSVYIVLAYAAIIALGNTVGLLGWGPPDDLAYLIAVREVIKTLVFAAAAYTIIASVDNWQDMNHLAWAVCLSLFLGAVTVVISAYNVEFAKAFASATKEVIYESSNYRPGGAFAEPNTVGGVMVLGLSVVVMQIQSARRFGKVVLILGAITMVIAIFLSRSRSGTLGLITLLASILVIKRLRAWGVATFLAIAVALLMLPNYYTPVVDRLTGSFDLGNGELSGDEGTRSDIWLRHLNNLDTVTLLSGQGQGIARWREDGIQPHSGYLDLVCYYGVWGAFWFGALVLGFAKRARMLLWSGAADAGRLAQAGMLLFGMMLWVSVWADTFAPGSYEFLLLVMILAVMDRGLQMLENPLLTASLRRVRRVQVEVAFPAQSSSR